MNADPARDGTGPSEIGINKSADYGADKSADYETTVNLGMTVMIERGRARIQPGLARRELEQQHQQPARIQSEQQQPDEPEQQQRVSLRSLSLWILLGGRSPGPGGPGGRLPETRRPAPCLLIFPPHPSLSPQGRRFR